MAATKRVKCSMNWRRGVGWACLVPRLQGAAATAAGWVPLWQESRASVGLGMCRCPRDGCMGKEAPLALKWLLVGGGCCSGPEGGGAGGIFLMHRGMEVSGTSQDQCTTGTDLIRFTLVLNLS